MFAEIFSPSRKKQVSKPNPRILKIQSLLRQNEFKKAYKEAKFLAGSTNDSEVKSLLCVSLWSWIKEQARQNQREEAKINVHELLRMQNVPAEIQAEFPPVFRVLGLGALLPESLRQDTNTPELQIELLDLFLLRGGATDDISPENLADARRIQEAFKKVEAKLDVEALEIMRPIGFRSPLADWRLLIRGLIDHYNSNDEKADESWRRLSPKRPPFRIAEQLRNLLHEKQTAPQSKGFLSGFFGLFFAQNDSSMSQKTAMIDTLRSLESYLQQKKYKELLGRFQSAKSQFQKNMPVLYDRLLRLIQCRLIADASPDIVKQFVERNLPLSFDPYGNRTYAILSGYIGSDSEFRRPNWLALPPVYWKRFVENDIDKIESFSPQLKARAKSVVYDYIAKRTLEGLIDVREMANFDTTAGSSFTENAINDYLEKAIACDPTYLEPYGNLQRLYLELLPENELNPFPPKITEIHERLLKHVPDKQESLSYLFEYHCNACNPETAKDYFDRLREIDPLSRETAIRRTRICLMQTRDALMHRNYMHASAALAELKSGPPLDTMFYRFDLLPHALGYINDALCGRTKRLEDHFDAASRLGIERRLPLIFAILADGKELGLPNDTIKKLESEWSKAISGACNANTAGALGDLAMNVLTSESRFRKSKKLAKEACDYVNRSGNVKWKCEKDLFGACNLLWHLAVEEEKYAYGKTFRTLAKKGLKEYPRSPFFEFFNLETFWLEEEWRQDDINEETEEGYEKFIQRHGRSKNDPQLATYVSIAELRLKKMDDDDFDDDDFDDNDNFEDYFNSEDCGDDSNPFGFPPNFVLPPEVRKFMAQQGGIPPHLLQELLKSLPKEFGPFKKHIGESVEECLLKGIPMGQFDQVMMQKLKNMSTMEQMKFMALMINSEIIPKL